MSTREWLESHAYHVGVADARWFIPLLTTLDKIEIGMARFKPWPEAHNIWEHLLHIQFWLKEGMLRMDGEREDPEADFPSPPDEPSEEMWDEFRGSVRGSLETLLDQIRAIPDDQIDAPCVGLEIARGELVAGLLAHLAYHLGQIRLLRGLYLHRT